MLGRLKEKAYTMAFSLMSDVSLALSKCWLNRIMIFPHGMQLTMSLESDQI